MTRTRNQENSMTYRRLCALAVAAALPFSASYALAENKPAPAAPAPAAAVPADAPNIVCEQPIHDFKERVMGEDTTHIFKIKNTGKSVLKIERAQASCGCTVPSGYANEVAPGGSTEITVKYDNKNRPGAFHKVVTVYSNDPDQPQFQLTIQGTIKTEIKADPMNVYLNEIFRDSLPTPEITLSTDMLDKVEISKVESSSPNLVTPSIIDVPGDPKSKKVKLTFSKEAPLGLMSGQITIHTNAKQSPTLTVPFTATVYGDLKVTPNAVNFAIMQGGNGTTEQVITIVDTKGKGDLAVASATDAAGRLDITIEPSADKKEFKVKAKLKPTYTTPGHFNGQIEINTNRKGEERLTINYNGFISAAQPEAGK